MGLKSLRRDKLQSYALKKRDKYLQHKLQAELSQEQLKMFTNNIIYTIAQQYVILK